MLKNYAQKWLCSTAAPDEFHCKMSPCYIALIKSIHLSIIKGSSCLILDEEIYELETVIKNKLPLTLGGSDLYKLEVPAQAWI